MPPNPIGNRDLIRAINRSAVLNTIKTQGPISRVEVARLTGLSAATISGITSELIDDALIFEKETGDSIGGRRPILLVLNPLGGYVVGLKLMENQVVGVLTDLEATVLAKQIHPLDNPSLQQTIDALSFVVESLVSRSNLGQKQLLGVGLGLAGIIDSQQGRLRYSPIFGWRDVPIGDLLSERVHAPVYIGNDVDTLTLAEKWFGKGQGLENFLTVTIGRGVGLGIVVNGQIYSGFHGGAGEFGHTVIDPSGPICTCGNHGCLETYVSDRALLREAIEAVDRAELPETVQSLDDLLQQAQEGQPFARAIYAQAGQVLGRGIANLINILSPQQIILSGEGVRAGELVFGPMRDAMAQHIMPGLVEDTEMEVDVWNDDAWARGAASLVLQELFKSPIFRDSVRMTV
jgi:predicted NBD/HSP70 family sugar kinase